ncbi:UNVERIFIED_CONTAM: hypothetical protein K2H54_035216 [Gekko kuhli]
MLTKSLNNSQYCPRPTPFCFLATIFCVVIRTPFALQKLDASIKYAVGSFIHGAAFVWTWLHVVSTIIEELHRSPSLHGFSLKYLKDEVIWHRSGPMLPLNCGVL